MYIVLLLSFEVYSIVVHHWKSTNKNYALPPGVGRNGGVFQSHLEAGLTMFVNDNHSDEEGVPCIF